MIGHGDGVPEKYQQAVSDDFIQGPVGLVDEGRHLRNVLIQKVKDLSYALNITSFKELGIKKSDFPEIAQKSFENNSNPSNPREVTTQDYLDILSKAFSDT